MSSGFDTTDWHGAVGRLVAATDSTGLADALANAIGKIADHEGTCLLAIHRQSGPEVVHHTLEPAGREHYLDRYLAGPYLLDPLYQLALDSERPEVCRFRDKVPDRFRSSQYYRRYCERTHLLDEMDYFCEVSSETTLALVVGRRTRKFSRAELDRLRLVAPTVIPVMRSVWERRDAAEPAAGGRDDMHRRLTECFEHFGESVLTDREREISQLLLRGHSSKSVARVLDIAPGTVMVHKRNLFGKLGISSQYQLFSLFIENLGK